MKRRDLGDVKEEGTGKPEAKERDFEKTNVKKLVPGDPERMKGP